MASEESVRSTSAVGEDVSRPAAKRRPWLGLACGVLAGAVAFGILQACFPVFTVPADKYQWKWMPPPDELQEMKDAYFQADCSNRLLFLGVFGALVSGALAAGEAMVRRSWSAALVFVPLCGLAGFLFGGLAGAVGIWLDKALDPAGHIEVLMETFQIQIAMLASFGAGVGLAVGLAGRRIGAVAMGLGTGLLAGGLAGAVYPVLCCLAAPQATTQLLIPESIETRLFWIGPTAVLLGVAIPGLAFRGKKPSAPVATAATS